MLLYTFVFDPSIISVALFHNPIAGMSSQSTEGVQSGQARSVHVTTNNYWYMHVHSVSSKQCKP